MWDWLNGYARVAPALNTGVLAAIFIAIIKVVAPTLPKLRELAIGQRRDDMQALRDQIARQDIKIENANKKADEANEKTNQMALHMVTMKTAFQLVAGELQKHDPQNLVLRQAKELIKNMMEDDLGWGEVGKQLAMMPGVVREIKASTQES